MRRTLVALALALAATCAHADSDALARRTDAKQQRMKLFVVRLDKAAYVVGRLYHYGDRHDFAPYVGHLIAEHERLERASVAKGKRAQGYGAAYWYSLVYGAADFGLRCYATAPGACAGPMDVKHYPLVMDPRKNVTWHCEEMLGGYVRGYRGRGLCEFVFYPAAPRDWGGGRFRRTEATMQRCLARGQRLGLLGPRERNVVVPMIPAQAGKPKTSDADGG